MELPQGSFAVGAATAVTSRMDMSLDDLIKQNRPPSTNAAVAQGASTLRRRSNPKAATRRSAEKPTAQQRSIGQSKAKRQADVNARRQSTTPPKKQQSNGAGKNKAKPTTMDVEKEVARVKNNKSLQTKTQKERATQQRSNRGPTKKAVSAAVRAMKDAGFEPPKGMQVVISFTPKESQEKQQQTKGPQKNQANGQIRSPNVKSGGGGRGKGRQSRGGRN